jgi:hypothetical protein
MISALFAPLVYTISRRSKAKLTVLSISKALLIGGVLTPVAVALHERIYEARFVESSRVIDALVPIG